MKNIVIVIGGPVINMGSQAMVRGLVRNVKEICPESRISVFATDSNFTRNLNLPGVDDYLYRYSIDPHKWNYPRVANAILRRVARNSPYLLKYKMYDFLKASKKSDIVIVIGGDNYDVSYNSLWYMKETNDLIDEIGRHKMVLYNCSVSKEDLNPDVVADMSRFRYLTARDSISFANMKAAMPNNDIRFFADAAFSMEPETVTLPDGWQEGNMIGINLSSLVADGRYGVTEDEVLNAYKRMLDYIIKETRLKICFIPHVKNNADLSELRILNDYVNDPKRAIIINHENFNAAQKKFVISQCRMFVGARTHSTIAAYSSKVPTLVIGYSIKSIGIAKDLLGTDKNNVIPVSALKDEQSLAKAIVLFIKRENEIRTLLECNVPQYIQSSHGVQDLIKEILRI